MRFHIRHLIDMSIHAMTIYTRSNSRVTKRKLKDLSEGGLCFKSLMPFTRGTRIHVRIPVQKPPFEARGRVSWCSQKGSGYEVGVEFERQSIDEMLRMVGRACDLKRYVRLEREKGRYITTDQAARERLVEYDVVIEEKVA
jgi:hypothetical protein